MRNIDQSLRLAFDGARRWDLDVAKDVADKFARGIGGTVDWDEGAGEEWLRVIASNEVMGFVSTQLPLAFVVNNPAFANIDHRDGLQLVTLASLDSQSLSSSEAVLRATFRNSPRLDVIDFEKFSANDLWYATV